jgi:hypothetical protein
MAKHTTWLRFDVGYPRNAKTLSIRTPEARMGFPYLVMWAREQGLLDEGIPVGDLTPHVMSVILLGIATDKASDCLEEWLRVGYVEKRGMRFFIPAWRKYKPDPTAAARQSRYRDRLKSRKPTEEDATRNETSLTPTGRDEDPPPADTDVSAAPRARTPARGKRKTTRKTYARAMRDAGWSGHEIGALLGTATDLEKLVTGHPWLQQMRDAQGWCAMQVADRPGIDLAAETSRAIRWLESNRNKSGNRNLPERFLGRWFDRARPPKQQEQTRIAVVGGGTYQEEGSGEKMRAYEDACAERDRERGRL